MIGSFSIEMHPLCGYSVTLSQAWLNATPGAVSLLRPAKDFSQQKGFFSCGSRTVPGFRQMQTQQQI
jgi:hypothetical protein